MWRKNGLGRTCGATRLCLRCARHRPDYLAGLRLNGENRIGVEVIAHTIERIPRRRIAGPPEYEVELGVVGPCNPGRAAAVGSGFAGPGLRARLSVRRYGVGAPQ